MNETKLPLYGIELGALIFPMEKEAIKIHRVFCDWNDVEPIVNELKQLKEEFSKVLSEAKRCCELGIEWHDITTNFAEFERLKKLVS